MKRILLTVFVVLVLLSGISMAGSKPGKMALSNGNYTIIRCPTDDRPEICDKFPGVRAYTETVAFFTNFPKWCDDDLKDHPEPCDGRLTAHIKEAIIKQFDNGFFESTRARGHWKLCYDPYGAGACEHVIAKGHSLSQGRQMDIEGQPDQAVEGNSELIVKKTYKFHDPENGKKKKLEHKNIIVKFSLEPPIIANGLCLAEFGFECAVAGAWFLHDADKDKGHKKKHKHKHKKKHKKKHKHKHKKKHKKSKYD